MNQLQPKVLLIEDDYEAAMSLCKKLKDRYGFDITTLSHGKNILGYLDQDYDVIVSDMYLPYLDGISLCQKIREHSDIPIIMISAEHHSALYSLPEKFCPFGVF